MNLSDRPRLRIGYVGVAFTSYFGEEYNQYERAIDGLTTLSESLDFDLVPIRQPVTDIGLAERAAGELRAGDIDYLLIQCATVASGELLPPLASVVPRVGVWGTPDPHQEGPIEIHSLVAVNHYTSIIQRYLGSEGPVYKWFFGHVDDDRFVGRFEITVRALRAIKRMSTARIGWIGGNSPGFYNMNFDEEVVAARLGTRVVAHDFSEIVDLTATIAPDEARTVVDKLAAAASEVLTSDDFMERGARLYLALEEFALSNGYAALAVQCWPKFQDVMGIAPCMAYGWLGSEDGFAVSCEGDVPGALSMLLLNELSDMPGSSTLLDMTALDLAAESMLMWHCGVSPRHFANDDGIRWVDHPTLGRKSSETYGVAGDQVFAAQDATIAYVGDDASELLVVRARIEERDVKGFDGTRGWFTGFELNGEPTELIDLVNTLMVGGHEHHYAVAQGDLTDELLEVAAWLGMRTVDRVTHKEYLQRQGVNV
ncbi:MAG TPA: hypothetical protein ENH00_12665 [Actinobacteria bacterium]|nr:hypothetical protein BMS3Bbin01_00219 [bacterium BMS3Bbin01]HDH27026.1 hypothetical protein [Actinomycetota bacterium]